MLDDIATLDPITLFAAQLPHIDFMRYKCVQFKRGLMARRFPGLKQMSEADIKALIVAERRARGGRKTVIDKKVYPKTDFVPASPKRDAYIPEPAAFLPVNPSQAKFEASRKPWEVRSRSLFRGIPVSKEQLLCNTLPLVYSVNAALACACMPKLCQASC